MKENNFWKNWIYWFVFGVLLIIIYKTLDNILEVKESISNLIELLMPFMLSILLAYLFYIPSRVVENLYGKSKKNIIKRKARLLGVLTVYVIALLIIVIAINFVIPYVYVSVGDLISNIPEYYNSATEYIENLPENSILNKVNIKEIIQNIQQIDFKQIISLDSLTQYAKGALGIASSILNIFITIIVSIYILLERKEILDFFKKLSYATLKNETYKKISKYFRKTNEIFFKFVSSQLLDSLVVGILISIALTIMKVRYGVLLGFMIGLFNIIPYFGAIIAVSLAIVITIFTGGFIQAIWVALIIIILQQIDANIINPKIVGNSLRLSPILVIFAVTIGGACFGILGMFLAVPIIAVLKICILDYINYRITKKEIT